MNNRNLLLLIALTITIAAALAVLSGRGIVVVPHYAMVASRVVVIAGLVAYAFRRRSLTTWILVFMCLGAEVGHDLPQVAQNLRVLSLIFLRMIRTIIAPLLFATLVVGIAGHSNLKQVGRMGIKALVYFELITTLALFIGLAAINLTKAGEGVNLAVPAATEQLNTQK